jgi:hypothetical protein
MRMDRPVEGGYRSAFSSNCGGRRSFLFGQTMPIQSAGVSGSGNRIIPRWRPN